VTLAADTSRISRWRAWLRTRRGRHALAAVWALAVIGLAVWYYWYGFSWPVDGFLQAERPTPKTGYFRDPGDVDAILESADKGDSLSGALTWFTETWTTAFTDYYRTVALASIWVDRTVWGRRSLPYRLHNVLLHILCTFLLAYLVTRLASSIWPGMLAGLIWACYPWTVGAVMWIAGRTDLLAAFFYLLALIMVVIMKRNDRRWYLWPASLLCFLLSLGSKEVAVTLPVLVSVWMVAWRDPPSWGRRLLIAASYWVVLVGFWAARSHALGTLTSDTIISDRLVKTGVHLWWARFMFKGVTDWFLYPPWLGSGWLMALTPTFYKFILYQTVFWGSAVLLWRTCRRPAVAAVVWKGVTVVPIFMALPYFVWTHYWYLPCMGTVALIALVVWQVCVALPSVAAWARRVAVERGLTLSDFSLRSGGEPASDSPLESSAEQED